MKIQAQIWKIMLSIILIYSERIFTHLLKITYAYKVSVLQQFFGQFFIFLMILSHTSRRPI